VKVDVDTAKEHPSMTSSSTGNPLSRLIAGAEPTAAPASAPPLDSTDLYINRDLSLLAFQRRVFAEAASVSNPLLERFKFISILGSNIDEFFMVRVAGLWQQIETRNLELSIDGKSPGVQLELIRQDVTALMDEIYSLWRDELEPALRKAGIAILALQDLSPKQEAAAADTFIASSIRCSRRWRSIPAARFRIFQI